MIIDFENIMIEKLNGFKALHKKLPSRILYFRDGVSEGQFKQLLNTELTALKSACRKVEINYKPSITFVVVQKRHHTRFYPTRKEHSDGKYNNVMPGTVVDTDIVYPNQFQYFLVITE